MNHEQDATEIKGYLFEFRPEIQGNRGMPRAQVKKTPERQEGFKRIAR
jgi:hypothetical protein